MLKQLKINNLAVVESLKVDFDFGLNVITGETGSGKSLIITAIKLLLGERADKTMIRTGEESITVFAEFQFKDTKKIDKILEKIGLDPCINGCLFLRRLISENSSRNFINDEPVTLNILKKLSELIVDMHGPYEHQSLLDSQNQLLILDNFGDLKETLQNYQTLYIEYNELLKKIDSLKNQSEKDLIKKINFIEHQINEIKASNLSIKEEEEIIKEYNTASNFKDITELSNTIINLLSRNDNSIYENLIEVQKFLKELEKYVPDCNIWIKELDSAMISIRDVISSVESQTLDYDITNERIQWLDERLALYQKIKHKYEMNVDEIIENLSLWEDELSELKEFDNIILNLTNKKDALLDEVLKEGLKLREKRELVADNLSELITKELMEIGFENSFFDVSIIPIDPSLNGIDHIEFGFAPNSGEEMRPLRSIASSGEISRVMLAVKGVLAKQDSIPILVFDEIDANIGGEIGVAVGQKLLKVSKDHQILCITHLPQVASFGSSHIAVSKNVEKGRTYTKINLLDKENRSKELARMLGGNTIDDISLKHAQAMLKEN